MDKFEELFRLQHDLQTETYGYNFQRMLPADRILYIKEMYIGAGRELGEALDETGWKSWATSRHINRDAYVGELVDVLHFWINMLLVLGDDPADIADEVFNGYLAKRQRNVERQAEGYDGVSTKCPKCWRALDDPAVECSIAPEAAGADHAWCAVYGMYKRATV
jgi:hypothetical protein